MRPTIDQSLMRVAHVWEDRSTCSRNHVGVVITREGRVIGSGYNGAPAGMDHCDHGSISLMRAGSLTLTPGNVGLPVSSYDRGCKIAIHAEANAISYAARHGVVTEGASLYTTLSPCYACAQLIISAGLVRCVFDRSYRDPAGIDLLRNAGLIVDHLV